MRQTLFRIRLDDIWSLEPVGGVMAVGLGNIVLLLWLLVALKWMFGTLRTSGINRQQLPSLLTWLGSAVVVLLVGGWLIPDHVTSIPVFGYGFMLFLGFFTAAWSAARRARSVGIEGDVIWDLAMWIMVSGILGARLFYVIQYRDRVFAGKTGLERLTALINLPDGGLVLYGGVICALFGFILFCRRNQVKPLLMADIIMPSFFVGLAFGRLGCLLNGCCYGDPSHLPWAVQFPNPSVPFSALVGRGFLDENALATFPLHPTQIYSSLNALMLAFLTASYFKHRRQNGAVLALSLLRSAPLTSNSGFVVQRGAIFESKSLHF